MAGPLFRPVCATLAIILLSAPGGFADDPASSPPASPTPLSPPSPTQTLSLVCLAGTAAAFSAMETAAVPSSCWYHIGHHHYFVGVNKTYRLWGGSGLVFTVEQNGFSPSVETLALAQQGDLGLITEVPIEISMDGLNWSQVADAEFHVVAVEPTSDPGDIPLETACDNTGACQYTEGTNTLACLSLPGGCHDTYWRQLIEVNFAATGEEFRFIRFSTPKSIYTGLSGFLDGSNVGIQVTNGTNVSGPALVPRTNVPLDCTTDIMEDFFASSPCRFGGYVLQDSAVGPTTHIVGNHPGQWDSPSFFHTYPLGNGSLDAISGSVLVRDWRNNAVPATRGIHVQTSVDGEAWTTVHTFSVTRLTGGLLFQVPDYAGNFAVTLTNHDARFVRLVAETMPGWATTASSKHPWAFFLDSDIALSGDLPAGL